MCPVGLVPKAILGLAMVRTSPSVIRQPDNKPYGWVGAGACGTFDMPRIPRGTSPQRPVFVRSNWKQATGFNNGPMKHISYIVITSIFLLVALGVVRSRPLR